MFDKIIILGFDKSYLLKTNKEREGEGKRKDQYNKECAWINVKLTISSHSLPVVIMSYHDLSQ